MRFTTKETKELFYLNEGKRIFKDYNKYSNKEIRSYAKLVHAILGSASCKDQDILISKLILAMRILSKEQLLVLSLRFGLNGYNCTPLRDIGKTMYYSHEGVRKIQCKGLRRLRMAAIKSTYVISSMNMVNAMKRSMHPASNILIEDLGLSTRTLNSLKRVGIDTASELLATPENTLKKIKGIGVTSLKAIAVKKHFLLETFPTLKTVAD